MHDRCAGRGADTAQTSGSGSQKIQRTDPVRNCPRPCDKQMAAPQKAAKSSRDATIGHWCAQWNRHCPKGWQGQMTPSSTLRAKRTRIPAKSRSDPIQATDVAPRRILRLVPEALGWIEELSFARR